MKKATFLILMAVVMLFIGCGKQYIVTNNYYLKPKKDRFKFKDLSPHNNGLIDTGSLYVVNVENPKGWLKFYKNGKVFKGSHEDIPKDSNLVARLGGFVGYYKVEGTRLTMELYYTQQFNQWSYLVVEGTISGDTLRFYSDKYRGSLNGNIHHFTAWEYAPDRYYIKSSAPYQLKTPDW